MKAYLLKTFDLVQSKKHFLKETGTRHQINSSNWSVHAILV